MEAFGHLLDFETALRETLIARLSPTQDWWKAFVPDPVRKSASERRQRDRESSFAPMWTYHQIYFCYLEDLRQIIQRASSLLFEKEPKAIDLASRFEEVVALRNRAAHGRLLSESEADRVEQLTNELRQLLRIDGEPVALSLEDPEELRAKAKEYFRRAIDRLGTAELPEPPGPLASLIGAPSTQDEVKQEDLATLVAATGWLRDMSARSRTPGYRLDARRELEKERETGLVQRAGRIIDDLVKGPQ
jgi:hypothetical protein